ncbi:MAG TPA: acyl-CoA thioesterase II [Acidimicrobiia bacterium]|nr:acyl-CoA thioesterase II [Acidimicrobiia bacterium]
MGSALDDLVDILDLERLEVNLFRGISLEEGRIRVFGGQVLAQAIIAAGRTVDAEIPVHSLHAYFLRPGDPNVPIVYDVDRIRDGRSFTTRRVVAVQHGRAIFNLASSFQVLEDGPEHSDPMPDVPVPEALDAAARPRWRRPELARSVAEWRKEQPIEMRFVGTPTWARVGQGEPDQDVWQRTVGELPDDPLLHAAIVAYASDHMLLSTATLPHTSGWGEGKFMTASLDHVMWFHRPCRADEWLLYHLHSPAAAHARGLSFGAIFRRDGVQCVTVAQEGLMRPVR